MQTSFTIRYVAHRLFLGAKLTDHVHRRPRRVNHVTAASTYAVLIVLSSRLPASVGFGLSQINIQVGIVPSGYLPPLHIRPYSTVAAPPPSRVSTSSNAAIFSVPKLLCKVDRNLEELPDMAREKTSADAAHIRHWQY
jgi:hypothetical protein